MPCCNLRYFLCFKKKEKRKNSFISDLPKKNSETIKKKKREYDTIHHPSIEYLFKSLHYENEKIKSIPKLFANRSINHHNDAENREQKKSQN